MYVPKRIEKLKNVEREEGRVSFISHVPTLQVKKQEQAEANKYFKTDEHKFKCDVTTKLFYHNEN